MAVQEDIKSNPFLNKFSKVLGTQFFWIVSFAVLMFFAAQVSIPVKPVPFTLQTMFVLLSGAFLGSRNGAASQILYIIVGIAGLPVFAGFSFGLPILLGPTGGYLMAFPVAAYFVGYIVERNRQLLSVSLSMIVGTLLILFSGAAYLSLFFNGNLRDALFAGVFIFSFWGLIKIAAAVSIYSVISKRYPRLPE